jgi:TetR/AcrR family transcriptional regulator, transcriptional repressor of bet genes
MTVTEHPMEAAPPRKAARGVRRVQLIDATIAALARKGFAALTVADVAKQAGLSPGIVIFHFTSKDELLGTVLNALATEYHQNWNARVEEAGPSAAERIKAMLLADFDTSVFTLQKIAAWIAFWGETQGRPVYDEVYSSLDAERRRASEALCRELITEGGYALDPHLTMCTLEALGDGLWLGLAGEYANRDGQACALDAHKVIMAALSALFPRHFPAAA